jgi:hypothetical protein
MSPVRRSCLRGLGGYWPGTVIRPKIPWSRPIGSAGALEERAARMPISGTAFACCDRG